MRLLNSLLSCSSSLAIALVFAALSLSSQVRAQAVDATPGVALSDDGTRVIYGPEFYAPFNAVTAIDILRRIPGIQDLLNFDSGGFVPGGSFDAVEKRGFGSEGQQILINGERVSGKTNDTGAALQRIQARQVERVEVIRGAVAGLDVRSEGLVVNVVLKEATGSGSWEARATHYTGGRVQLGGRVSYAGVSGKLNYNLSAENAPKFLQRDRSETFFALTGTPFQRNLEKNDVITGERILTGGGSYAFENGGKLALNGRYSDKDELEKNPTYKFALAGQALTFLNFDDRERDTAIKTWELGGDYSLDFSGGGQFKSLFVYTHENFNRINPFRLTLAGGPELLTRLQNEDRTESEKIVRSSYSWPWSDVLSAEVGAEVAINTLSKDVQMSVDAGRGLLPVPLFNAQSKIRETRLEPFSSFAWQAADGLFVDLQLEAEYSKLKQTGRDVNNNRSLFYLRPGLDVRYDVAPLNQLRASIKRNVGQLDFADFVATFEGDDSRAGQVNAGNPDLVPEKAWEYSLTYERRLAGDGGVLTAKLFYNQISDLLDNVSVGQLLKLPLPAPNAPLDPAFNISSPGNVGAAKQYGVETKASIRLTALGLKGVVVNATGLLRDSEFTDPFTGRKAPTQDYPTYAYTFGFRHDTEWRDLSYGVTFDDESLRKDLEISTTHSLNRRFDGTVFVELKALPGIKAKLEVRRIFRSGAERIRSTYVGNRGLTPLLRMENRVAIFDRAIAFSLRGTF